MTVLTDIPSLAQPFAGFQLEVEREGDWLRVRIPFICCKEGYIGAIAALHELRRRVAPDLNWVVDVSAVRPVPLALQSVLIAQKDFLHKSGRQFRVVGTLPDDATAAEALATFAAG